MLQGWAAWCRGGRFRARAQTLQVLHACSPQAGPSEQLRAPVQVHAGAADARSPNRTAPERREAGVAMEQECGHLVHLANLFAPRVHFENDTAKVVPTWHWVFETIVKPFT